jgi:hypothetical protein
MSAVEDMIQLILRCQTFTKKSTLYSVHWRIFIGMLHCSTCIDSVGF